MAKQRILLNLPLNNVVLKNGSNLICMMVKGLWYGCWLRTCASWHHWEYHRLSSWKAGPSLYPAKQVLSELLTMLYPHQLISKFSDPNFRNALKRVDHMQALKEEETHFSGHHVPKIQEYKSFYKFNFYHVYILRHSLLPIRRLNPYKCLRRRVTKAF